MSGASARYSCFCTPVETSTPPRRSKLRIIRFRLWRKLVHSAAPPLPAKPVRRLCGNPISQQASYHSLPPLAKARSLRCSSSPHKACGPALRGPHFTANLVSFASLSRDLGPPFGRRFFRPSPARDSPRPGCLRSPFSSFDPVWACRSSPARRPLWRPPSPCPRSPCRRRRSRRPDGARRPP